MNRRDFLSAIGAAGVITWVPQLSFAAEPRYERTLILIELKGGNDGLNTVVPYASSDYYNLRPRIAIPRDRVLQIDERTGLHPALQPLVSLWESRELAIVQGLGYPKPNLSHFRSIEIWDTAAASDEYLNTGWLTRAFGSAPVPKAFAADGVVIASAELGPLAGVGTRALALTTTEQFLRQARLATPLQSASTGALQHILKVESDVAGAATQMNAQYAFKTEFPKSGFGVAMRTTAEVLASSGGVAAIKVSLNGFDTHSNQVATQARLLSDFAQGLVALKSALVEIGRWDSTLVMTYAEFGRRPRENASGGTDHGTTNPQFVLGGRVKGGLYGAAPELDRLDGNGNLAYAVDFRSAYATVLERWWGIDSSGPLRGRFATLDVLRG